MGKIRVLLFEDDDSQALLTREALEAVGYHVDVAATGKEGLQRLFGQDYDAYLVDIKLPDINGVEVLRRTLTVKPNALVIIVTGNGDEMAAVEAMKLGAYDYVVKSAAMTHLTTLPALIREGVGRASQRGEREALQTELWEQARLLEERNAELRRLNRELKRFAQLKADLTGMIGQDIQERLAEMQKLAGGGDGASARRMAEQTGALQAAMATLAEMVKVGAGQIRMDKEFVDLSQLVQQAVQSLRPIANTRRVDVMTKLPPGKVQVFADAQKISQVLAYWISNAMQHTPDSGRVVVSLEIQPDEVRCHVSDSGSGMPPELCARAFEPRAQKGGEPASSVGMGGDWAMALSKRLVELHYGKVWVDSSPAAGTTFSFALPKRTLEEAFREHLQQGINSAKVDQKQFSVIAFAMPTLSEIAAQHGQKEMENLLASVQDRLTATIRRRAGDQVIRGPHGEMAAILAQVDQEGSRIIAHRTKDLLEQQKWSIGPSQVTVPFQTAIATYPDEAGSAEALGQLIAERLEVSGNGRGGNKG